MECIKNNFGRQRPCECELCKNDVASESNVERLVIFALLEVGYEGSFLHAVFKHKRSALKEMLNLKKKLVAENLEGNRMDGDLDPDFYRNTWDHERLVVEPYDLITAI